MIKISTSILSATDRVDSIKKLNNTNSDYLHIDAMDSHFVPNKQMPISEILEFAKVAKIPLDIHLMVENPEEYLTHLGNMNIECITIHIEINKDIYNLIDNIKSLGYKVGLSLRPNTPIEKVLPYLPNIDLVLIMSVEPGYGGQKFIPASLDKAKALREINKDITIEMDGGINNTNIKEIKQFVDIAVVGSYITNSPDYNQAINYLKN